MYIHVDIHVSYLHIYIQYLLVYGHVKHIIELGIVIPGDNQGTRKELQIAPWSHACEDGLQSIEPSPCPHINPLNVANMFQASFKVHFFALHLTSS